MREVRELRELREGASPALERNVEGHGVVRGEGVEEGL